MPNNKGVQSSTGQPSAADSYSPTSLKQQQQLTRTTKTTTTTTTTTIQKTTKQQADGSSGQPSVARVEELGRKAATIESREAAGKTRALPVRQPSGAKSIGLSGANSTVEDRYISNGMRDTSDESRLLLHKASEIELANRDELIGGNRLVTTVSSIAVQSGQSRIVLALLKDGDSLQLKVQEMKPGIFEVGANYKESIKFLEEHQKLIMNLRKQRQTPIEAWWSKYQQQVANPTSLRSDKANALSNQTKLVYMCMAENLQAGWRALLGQLEQRSRLLDETCKFFESSEQLARALDKAEHHVQICRQQLLDGPSGGAARFTKARNELLVLNQVAADQYQLARKNQLRLIDMIGALGAGNLGDSRTNLLLGDARTLIQYIGAYLEPFERRRLQLESVITTTRSMTTTTTTKTTNFLDKSSSRLGSSSAKTSLKQQPQVIREICNFNDLTLADNWLQTKIEQLNSSLLSSLGISVSDSRSILGKHEQIALECRAIEEATLTFKGKSIYAIKSIESTGEKGQKQSQEDKATASLFEQQKALATRTRDVITILEARIVLLRRTIDFYIRSKEASLDIGKMMRRLQVDNSLQSVQFVANELELKDVSSVVASGATIISELQQLQLAQQHGQRSNIVNLNLVTNGIRSIIDRLNQDLAHLKTVLNQRRLVLLNEDTSKMANSFSQKSRQLHNWLESHVKSYLISSNQLNWDDARQARAFCEAHEKLRVSLQNKTLEVEALLRSLPTLLDNLDPKSSAAEEIQSSSDELRQNWISTTNCLDRRLDLLRKVVQILATVSSLEKELDSLERFNSGAQGRNTPEERTDEEIRANIEQSHLQLANQIRNFSQEARRSPTELTGAGKGSDLNKQQVIEHLEQLLKRISDRLAQLTTYRNPQDPSTGGKRAPEVQVDKRPAHQRAQQASPPRFTRVLVDKQVEPFSSVELECETDQADCQIDWFMNNFRKIPSSIKHSTLSEANHHRLIISNFSPHCCGTWQVRASNGAGQAVSQCRLRLQGIREVASHDEQQQQQQQVNVASDRPPRRRLSTELTQIFQGASPASTTRSFSQWRPANKSLFSSTSSSTSSNKTTVKSDSGANSQSMARIIQGVESSCEPEEARPDNNKGSSSAKTNVSDKRGDMSVDLPVNQASYVGPPANNSLVSSSNRLRVNYTASPVSSATLSRSCSKSPLDGSPQAPVFVQGLQDAMSRSCSRAGLVCLVVGNPAPSIEWLHNNQTIATTKCTRNPDHPNQKANICKLTIETMNPRTQGHYECRASNRVGQSSTGLTLTK